MNPEKFHSRINKLINNQLATKANRTYSATSLGKLVYEAQALIGAALQSYWHLVALDSICSEHSLPIAEHKKLLNNMVQNERLQVVLMDNLLHRGHTPNEIEKGSQEHQRQQQQEKLYSQIPSGLRG